MIDVEVTRWLDAELRMFEEHLLGPPDSFPYSELTTTQEWDGEHLVERLQTRPDGQVIWRQTWTYDPAGRLLRETVNDTLTTYVYEGPLVVRAEGGPVDGEPTGFGYWDYDADGREIRRERRVPATPALDQIVESTYLAPAPSLDRIEVEDRGADGVIDSEITRSFDRDGHEIRSEAAGELGWIEQWTRDRAGEPLERLLVSKGFRTVHTWDYDQRGLLLSSVKETDEGHDGGVEVRDVEAWLWSCID